MPPKPRITHDQAKRLIIQWHLMGVKWSPRMGEMLDEGPGEEGLEEASLGDMEDQ